MYVPTGTPNYIKQILMDIKGETDHKKVTRDLKTALTLMDRSYRQKMNRETVSLSDTVSKIGLIDIFRTFHPKTDKYTFFASAPETFSTIDHDRLQNKFQ